MAVETPSWRGGVSRIAPSSRVSTGITPGGNGPWVAATLKASAARSPARASSSTGGATSFGSPLAKSTISVSASAKMASCVAAFDVMGGSLERSGNEVLPALGSGSLTGWVHTRGNLAKEATSLGVARPGVYLPPGLGQNLSDPAPPQQPQG